MRDLRKEAAPTRRGVGAKSPAQHERKKLLPFGRGIREVMLDPLKAQRVSLGPEVHDSKTASGFVPDLCGIGQMDASNSRGSPQIVG